MISYRSVAVLSVFLAAPTVALAKEKTLVNADSDGIVLHGYDPVAYFTRNAAMKGGQIQGHLSRRDVLFRI